MSQHHLNIAHTMPGKRLKTSKGGASTLTVLKGGGESVIASTMPAIGAAAAGYPLLLCTDTEMLWDEGGQAYATIIYEGTASGPLPPAVYELNRAFSQDAIDSHKEFVDKLGGTKESPLNKAIFDEEGVFVGFPPDATNNMGGVSDYYAPSATMSKRYSSYTQPAMADLPQVGAPSGFGIVPSLKGSKNWLFAERTWSLRGTVYEIGEKLIASGSKGWNALIYPN